MIARDTFDVVVVGGGHAGCEAALAAARMGAQVALVTLRRDTIGALSCNPAMGGVGKGQLLREIDALGGEMGRATDATALHYRMLNTSKGEAVQALRAQVDKVEYPRVMQAALAATPNLTVIEGSVEGLSLEGGRLAGVRVGDSAVRAHRVVLTNGTFLRGLMHTGERRTAGGRVGEGAVSGLTDALLAVGFTTARLKTGTPPRLARDSIDWERTDIQRPDPEPAGFHCYAASPPRGPWIPCHVTRTNEQVHDVIRANLHRSPMYSGQIEGIGPRYCPSIEDKVVRFADKPSHTVTLELESLALDSVYVNGVSTSLPADVQESLVHAIPGLERAVFLRHGYAVEYDFFPPHQIEVTFESRPLPGLYLAGQICGTSGYEEAGAQGFLAGVNAVLSLRGEPPFVLGRDEAYIGVLADDLVRCDPREPYRMFTSRAEYRLLLRFDNADLRLAEKGEALGLVRREDADGVRARRVRIAGALARLRETRAGPHALVVKLRRPGARFDDLFDDHPAARDWDLTQAEREQIVVEARYETYIERQRAQVEKLRRYEEWVLPRGIDYRTIHGLGKEAADKLARFVPRTFGQARRIDGVTAADLSVLMVALHAGDVARADKPSEPGPP